MNFGGTDMSEHDARREIIYLPIGRILPNPNQPRRTFDQEALEELSASIHHHGILQPLTVRRTNGTWELVAGERRLRAAKLAGLTKVPCIPIRIDDQESALLALLENLQRQDLHFLEEADALAALIHSGGITQEEAAEKLGRSPSAVANNLRLRRLSPDCTALIIHHHLSERHARALLRLEDETERLAALRHITEKELNVAQTERYIESRLQALQTTPPAGRRTYIIKDVRLFLNSVDRGLQLIRSAGVDAQSSREDTEDAILLTLRIPKAIRKSAEL